MDKEPVEATVLASIRAGIKSFDKISKILNIPQTELEQILEGLESRDFITVNEKKGFLGVKVEINITGKGEKHLETQVSELRETWAQMITLYKSEDKENLKQFLDENSISLKPLIFFRILDMSIFSKIITMLKLNISDYISPKDMPKDVD